MRLAIANTTPPYRCVSSPCPPPPPPPAPPHPPAAPPAPSGPPVAPERERGAAQHDPDQDERQRDVEQRPEPREGRREAREQQDDREDEPDVVRLPHGADRLRDQLALTLPAGTAREQVPHAAPEVRASQQRVRVERHDDDPRDQLGETHSVTR